MKELLAQVQKLGEQAMTPSHSRGSSPCSSAPAGGSPPPIRRRRTAHSDSFTGRKDHAPATPEEESRHTLTPRDATDSIASSRSSPNSLSREKNRSYSRRALLEKGVEKKKNTGRFGVADGIDLDDVPGKRLQCPEDCAHSPDDKASVKAAALKGDERVVRDIFLEDENFQIERLLRLLYNESDVQELMLLSHKRASAVVLNDGEEEEGEEDMWQRQIQLDERRSGVIRQIQETTHEKKTKKRDCEPHSELSRVDRKKVRQLIRVHLENAIMASDASVNIESLKQHKANEKGHDCIACRWSSKIEYAEERKSMFQRMQRLFLQKYTKPMVAVVSMVRSAYERSVRGNVRGKPDWTPWSIWEHLEYHMMGKADIRYRYSQALGRLADEMRETGLVNKLVFDNGATRRETRPNNIKAYLDVIRTHGTMIEQLEDDIGNAFDHGHAQMSSDGTSRDRFQLFRSSSGGGV